MIKQWHFYVDQVLDERLSLLAKEEGLKNSEFVKMLVSKVWDERKGGSPIKIPSVGTSAIVEPSELAEETSDLVRADDKEFEDLVGPARQDLKPSRLPAVGSKRIPVIPHGRKRHQKK